LVSSLEKVAADRSRDADINRRAGEVYETAREEFGQDRFDKALGNFRAFDGLRADLAEAIFSTPNAHRVLFELGTNPDRIDRLYALKPTVAVMEIARTSERLANNAKATASQRTAENSAAAAGDFEDTDISMGEFIKRRERDLAQKRRAQRGGVRVY
jgi:hypothetical protein